MQPPLIANPRTTLPVLTVFGVCLLSYLFYAKFYATFIQHDGDTSEALRHTVLQAVRDHVTMAAATLSAGVGLAALLAPSLLRAAGATPLRALLLVTGVLLALGAALLLPIAETLNAEALRGFVLDGTILLVVALLLVFEGLLLLGAGPRGKTATAPEAAP